MIYYPLSAFIGEWVYKDAKPKIICEKFIETDDNKPPKDYKIFCFNGKQRMLFVASDRGTSTKFDFFTCEWEYIPVKQNYPDSGVLLEKPVHLAEILRISEILSKDFLDVRVDFYSEQGKLIFSEMIFFTSVVHSPLSQGNMIIFLVNI